MRQQNDIEFIHLLNSLRVGELTTAQLELLCERRHIPISGDFADGVAVRIFPTLRQVDTYNEKMTTENAKVHRTYRINAVDESREAATYGRKPPDNVIPKDINNCGGFLPTINLGVESRVMLRRNISVSDGLVNGAMGIVKKIIWPALRRDQMEEGELPEAVLIKFDDATIGLRMKDDDGCVAVSPVCTKFQAQKGYGDVERRMLPLILSWAVTVHKLQGTTLDKAVIDLGKKNFAKGQIYVALSRVKTLEGIVLSDLDANKLLSRPHDEKALTEMTRLRNLSKY
ncbi:ATP-dependent DNA helicase PIF1-like [Hyposmocoma kahamanoa]|uniref:ATP-dependent DNA helicase PIF1-like n=1 Tax=Hyposmocoma kahamanoa TaxID=1477025 RepID=UPI000E6D996A|nr:ATP-dependent DNA helicase PIF1-like [Hyposmocoma kahamanoa]